ncbi:DUF6939 family protein [Microscilla marina]|uniref:Uncharacterized protein n=1 Tax=Microscilla marina ATCC 23134 TaxID=313606 RepID=A1ZK43_MICM2|nr:hypothetical protein [Microscilla marina]EAY29069.1 hypothetical protein M23134_02260 [Microscilla marina ATCC 23134]
MIIVKHKSTPQASFDKRYPEYKIIDVTSKAPTPFVKLSPFYPIGDIPVPLSEGHFAQSVEGIWQGLKVFETASIDLKKLEVTTMKGLKRTVRKFGNVKGHQAGVNNHNLLPYIIARKQIYLPAYRWVLDHKVSDVLQLIKNEAEQHPIILLDYETNGDVENASKPLSHAYLVKYYLENNFPV